MLFRAPTAVFPPRKHSHRAARFAGAAACAPFPAAHPAVPRSGVPRRSGTLHVRYALPAFRRVCKPAVCSAHGHGISARCMFAALWRDAFHFAISSASAARVNGYVLYVSNISCLFEECLTETINTAQYSTFIDNNILFRSGILDYTSKKEKITLDDYLKSIVIEVHNNYKTLGFDNKYFISNLYSMYIHIELVLEGGEIKNYDINLRIADKK